MLFTVELMGKTDITIEQLSIIAEAYKISLDQLIFENSNSLIFQYNSYNNQVKSFEDFISQIEKAIYTFGSLPNFRAYYASNEIPIFIYLFFPKLLCFKLYVYGITVWNLASSKNRKFSFDLLSPMAEEKARKIADLYAKLPSVDVWTMSMIDNTLNQVEYLHTIGKFETPEDAYFICEELSNLVIHTRKMAEHGAKFHPTTRLVPQENTFDLYLNEFSTTNNTILGISDLRKVVFATFQHPNFLLCTDEKLCNMTELWFKELVNNSTPISLTSSKRRIWYFNYLQEKIQNTRKKNRSIRSLLIIEFESLGYNLLYPIEITICDFSYSVLVHIS